MQQKVLSHIVAWLVISSLITANYGDLVGSTTVKTVSREHSSCLSPALRIRYGIIPLIFQDTQTGSGRGEESLIKITSSDQHGAKEETRYGGEEQPSTLYSQKNAPWQRAVDIIICFSAVMPVAIIVFAAGVLIKLIDKQAVFIRQKRIGETGKPFVIRKLQTMKDYKVTPLGHYLRKGFDELPQLWNILKGEMSLFGPRPKLFSEILNDEFKKNMLSRRPGLINLLAAVVGPGRGYQPYDLQIMMEKYEQTHFSLPWVATLIAATAHAFVSPSRIDARLRMFGLRKDDYPVLELLFPAQRQLWLKEQAKITHGEALRLLIEKDYERSAATFILASELYAESGNKMKREYAYSAAKIIRDVLAGQKGISENAISENRSAGVILLLGGTGFVGQHVARQLLSLPDKKVVLGVRAAASAMLPRDFKDAIAAGRLVVREADITQKKSLAGLFNEFKGFEAVINLTGQAHAGNAESDPLGTLAVNTRGPLLLAQLSNAYGARFVHLSSTHLYSREVAQADEQTPLIASNIYEETKLIADSMIPLGSNNYAILRSSNIYGEGQRYQTAVQIFIKKALAGEIPAKISKDSLDFIHVADVANAVVKATDNTRHGIFNVATGISTPIYQVWELVKEHSGSAAHSNRLRQEDSAPPGRNVQLNIRKARSNLQWIPKIALADGIGFLVSRELFERAI